MIGNVQFINRTEGPVCPEPDPSEIPLAEVSLELGCHFYPHEWEVFAERGEILPQHLERGAAQYDWLCGKFGANAVSTCIFLDGYDDKLQGIITPSQAVRMLHRSATEAGVPLHYIGSEGACADLGSTVMSWVVAPPPPGSTGLQSATVDRGWVSNGLLVSGELEEYDTVPHSISLAIQIFKEIPGSKGRPPTKSWSCPYLASVWQLARFGLLPEDWLRPDEEQISSDTTWDDLSLITQLCPDAPPFSAHLTHTLLPKRYTAVVDAERLILDSLSGMPSRYRGERDLPSELSRLAEYTLTAD